jgi:hypothetical protein
MIFLVVLVYFPNPWPDPSILIQQSFRILTRRLVGPLVATAAQKRMTNVENYCFFVPRQWVIKYVSQSTILLKVRPIVNFG